MTEIPPVDIRFEIRLNADSPSWTREEYDRIYSTRGIRQLDSFYKWILDQIRPRPGARLLDVACGEGTLSHFAEERYAVRAHGSDLSVSALQIAAGEAAGPFAVGSGEELPYVDASFDYVTCIGSLEHFLDVRAGVRERVPTVAGSTPNGSIAMVEAAEGTCPKCATTVAIASSERP